MPGFIVHQGASVMCSHGGTALPVAPNPRVTVSRQAIVTMPGAYTVAGCGLAGSGGPFCATATFLTAATRVTSMLQPVLLQDSQSTCVATGMPLVIGATQPRVSAM
jgi:hypothetical protein